MELYLNNAFMWTCAFVYVCVSLCLSHFPLFLLKLATPFFLDPSWGVVNKGIMVCIECSGVHRSMGVHISKVRSVELDQNIWTDSLILVSLFSTYVH